MRILAERKLLVQPILDFGCGRGKDADVFGLEKFDPVFFPTLTANFLFRTVTCIYVLNILPPEKQREVLRSVNSHLDPGGSAFFAVRRDIQKNSAGPLSWWVELPEFESVFRDSGCEIFHAKKWLDIQEKLP